MIQPTVMTASYIVVLATAITACGGGGGGGGSGGGSPTETSGTDAPVANDDRDRASDDRTPDTPSSEDDGGPEVADGGVSSEDLSQTRDDIVPDDVFEDLVANDDRLAIVRSADFLNNLRQVQEGEISVAVSPWILNIDYQDGEPSAFTARVISNLGTPLSEDATNATRVVLNAETSDLVVTEGGRIVGFREGNDSALFIDREGGGYQFNRFGAWASAPDGKGGLANSFSRGVVAPAEDINPTGTYSGDTVGYQNIFGNPRTGEVYTATQSDVTIEVSGSDARFETSDTVLLDTDGWVIQAQESLDLSGELRVVDVEAVRADATLEGQTEIRGYVTGGDVAGSVEGIFYGPDGEEVGGTFHTRHNETGNNSEYVGAFGGRK